MTELDLEGVKRFHGHWCPGLATGIRVAEIALRELGPRSEDEELVALVETDNCAVDAVQYFTGCTFGKGNLIHLDYGKNAFTFIRRSDGKAIRIVAKGAAWQPQDPALAELAQRDRDGQVTAEERGRLREARIRHILESPWAELFEVQQVQPVVPAPAQVHQSVACAGCGERTMETRLRRFQGQWYCLPCFQALERRR